VCLPGYRALANTNGSCELCPLNETCLSGIISPCRPFSQAQSLGSFSQSNCTCLPGYYSLAPAAACQLCPADSYCPGPC
jgi:hypothetical protein